MQLFLEYRSYITLGNILTVITGIGSILTAVVLVYWKLRNLWLTEQKKFEKRIEEKLDEQTKHLEHCIHSIPGHPENIPPASEPE